MNFLIYNFAMLTVTQDYEQPRDLKPVKTYGKGRVCRRCPTHLSTYNPGRDCWVCMVREQRDLRAAARDN